MQSFEAFFEDPVYLLYKNHLYNYLSRRFVIRQMVRGKSYGKILELGCGISPMLAASDCAIRTDVSWKALDFLKSTSRNGALVRAAACDAIRLPFSSGTLDCVICSEVLEHIRDDKAVLEEIARVIKPGGELLLTCPIHQKYFGFDDEFVGHFRRYEVPDLLDRLSKAGFEKFGLRHLLGPLEKQIMEKVTRLFALAKRGERAARPLGIGFRILAWALFPVYLLVNYAVAICVMLQARLVSLEKAVTICIRCRKKG